MQHTTRGMLLFEPNTTSLIHCTVTNKLYLIQNRNARNNFQIKMFNSKFDLKHGTTDFPRVLFKSFFGLKIVIRCSFV